MKWMVRNLGNDFEQDLPYCPKGDVIVMDNTPCHSVQKMASSNYEVAASLQCNNITLFWRWSLNSRT
jgi:hypothetical protein